jgi:toxin ParE1/3/4
VTPATVEFHPAAAQEAESAYDWYVARNLAAAHAFREELRHAVEAVAQNPRMWPRYGRRARRYVFPLYPFSLVYRMRGDDFEVARCREVLLRFDVGGVAGVTEGSRKGVAEWRGSRRGERLSDQRREG